VKSLYLLLFVCVVLLYLKYPFVNPSNKSISNSNFQAYLINLIFGFTQLFLHPLNSHTFYITFKKIANSLDVMQCLESAQFPNYIGACKSNLFPKPKTWLKKDARSNGWKVNCAIGDTVFYYKMRQ
jgi:hypothetical protein